MLRRPLGIPDPNIQRVALRPSASFDAPIFIGKSEVFYKYTILGVQGDVLHIRLDARDSNRGVYSDNRIMVKLEAGKVVRLPRFGPGWPDVLLAILNLPTGDTAVIATGRSDSPRPG